VDSWVSDVDASTQALNSSEVSEELPSLSPLYLSSRLASVLKNQKRERSSVRTNVGTYEDSEWEEESTDEDDMDSTKADDDGDDSDDEYGKLSLLLPILVLMLHLRCGTPV
jgi:hypothetical protein